VDDRNSTPSWQTSDNRPAAPTQGRASEGGAGVFLRAAAVLQAQHDVTEMTAYEILVQEAAEACTSVRDVAYAVIAGSARSVESAFTAARESSR